MSIIPNNIEPLLERIAKHTAAGTVVAQRGSLISARLPSVMTGEVVHIQGRHQLSIPALVVGFESEAVQLLPLTHPEGICPGASVRTTGAGVALRLSQDPRGMVIDALGAPLSERSQPSSATLGAPLRLNIFSPPPAALSRARISKPLHTGVRTIDGLSPLAEGQRVGLFAPAGIGKSTLLGTLARNTECDLVVAALVGERGREVGEFLTDALGARGRSRSIVVCATSDEPPAKRMLAASTATALAEHYRSKGMRVLLLIDSLTRVARAMREVYLCMGELPVRQGYTPSVFTELPRLLERAGMGERGSITAVYTVLTNGEDDSDPLAEELTSLLDGHLCMSNRVALRGIRPAIDPTRSISRLTNQVRSADEQRAIQSITSGIARLWREKDLLLFGGQPDASLSRLLSLEGQIVEFLSQRPELSFSLAQTREQVMDLAAKLPRSS